MKHLAAVLCVAFITAFSADAHALFEVRVGAGVAQSEPSDINEGQASSLKLEGATAFNVDAIIMPPLFPIGFGIRYERMWDKAEGGGNSVEADVGRIALLVNKRFIDSVIYVGALGTFGISDEAELVYDLTGPAVKYKSEKVMSWSVGAEAGVNLLGFTLSGEAGYQGVTAEDFKYGSTTLAGNPELDLGGPYAKIMLGFGF